jgi:diaminopimelate decarboxylase
MNQRSRDIRELIEYIQSLDNYKTTISNAGGGISISYKTAEK